MQQVFAGSPQASERQDVLPPSPSVLECGRGVRLPQANPPSFQLEESDGAPGPRIPFFTFLFSPCGGNRVPFGHLTFLTCPDALHRNLQEISQKKKKNTRVPLTSRCGRL